MTKLVAKLKENNDQYKYGIEMKWYKINENRNTRYSFRP